MTLELEKITDKIDSMAQSAAQRLQKRQDFTEDLLLVLEQYASDWVAIEAALDHAQSLADPKHYRSARPFTHTDPLNAAIDPPTLPSQATIIATDGSQIMPDRHAAHLYYLLNVGGIIYYHGGSRTPDQFTEPELHFPTSQNEANFLTSSGEVSIARDLLEIGKLADVAWNQRGSDVPVLAILDQRLLYWPIGGPEAGLSEVVEKWLRAMTKINDSGALLAGYIDRPMTTAVTTLLRSLQGLQDQANFDWKSLGKAGAGGGLTDGSLFYRILKPGQRSKVFVSVSPPNERFAEQDKANEVCFFYFNPGRGIARVDIPRWVAKSETAVATVHALIYDQCRILGDYPYIIARADEMAVVGHQDQEELNFLIDLHMQRYGIESRLTAKQSSKGLARGGKTRHGL
ncbi:MAG: DNA double-strand break repair nuclease NurA [Ardenticatenaceae bacterium]|nr:DNA double-strand break repair nuclease NurA [Ardenticatenaceae bacterium]MCB9444118.1 DNA double-strand break repair nuclease NurA [Ardenticatenaceae bacterium]